MRLACALILCGASASAGTFTPPKGCTAYLTVQSRQCLVEHHWTCAADPQGMKWHTEIGQNGPVYIGQVDDEAQWIDSYYVGDDARERLVSPAKDPANLTELLSNGLDSYQFSISTSKGRMDVTGFDRIVERDLTIDGEVLHRTEYSIRIVDTKGALSYAATGSEYVSAKHRRFFSGYGTVSGPDAPYDFNASPVEFIYPGAPGYLSNTPLYGCDVVTARAVISERTLP